MKLCMTYMKLKNGKNIKEIGNFQVTLQPTCDCNSCCPYAITCCYGIGTVWGQVAGYMSGHVLCRLSSQNDKVTCWLYGILPSGYQPINQCWLLSMDDLLIVDVYSAPFHVNHGVRDRPCWTPVYCSGSKGSTHLLPDQSNISLMKFQSNFKLD